MTRGGRRKERAGPERRCLVTGESRPKAGLIRFVVGPDGGVCPDVMGKLPGRGMYLSADREVLVRAERSNPFPRAAKTRVTIPDHLIGQVEAALVRRVVGLISLARKAGQAVAGFEKVNGWSASGRVRVLIQASNGSRRGRTKLRAPREKGWFVDCLTASEIGLAFDRESVIHGALSGGGLAMRVVEEATRLSGVRGNDGGTSTGKDTTNA